MILLAIGGIGEGVLLAVAAHAQPDAFGVGIDDTVHQQGPHILQVEAQLDAIHAVVVVQTALYVAVVHLIDAEAGLVAVVEIIRRNLRVHGKGGCLLPDARKGGLTVGHEFVNGAIEAQLPVVQPIGRGVWVLQIDPFRA